MKILAITQARYGSSRLPGKIMKQVEGKSILEIHLERILRAASPMKLVVATTFEKESPEIIEVCNKKQVDYFRGSTENVLERFYFTAEKYCADIIVRLTSDCPLIDPSLIDEIISCFIKNDLDYCSNTLSPTYPDGQDIEVFTFNSLKKAHEEARSTSEIEHVTPYIWKNSTFFNAKKFKSFNYASKEDYSKVRMTLDTLEDFETIKFLISKIGSEAKWKVYADYYLKNYSLMKNHNLIRNEGYTKSLNNKKNEL